MVYEVYYTETYEGFFDIEADSEDEAIDNFYKNEEYLSKHLECTNRDTEVVKRKMWAPSDNKKTEPEFDPMIFDVDNWF